MGRTVDPQPDNTQRVRPWNTQPYMDVSIKSLLSGFPGNPGEEPEGIEDTKKIRSTKHRRTDVHRNSQRRRQHAQGLYWSIPDRVLELKEVDYTHS